MNFSRRAHDDRGAAAVEMAIVTPLLLLLLFGIIQYGMLFHSMQAASATARDAAHQAAHGIEDCAPYIDDVSKDAKDNGVPGATPWTLEMIYDLTPTPSNQFGTVRTTLTYYPENAVPFIPMPSQLVQTAIAPVEDISAVKVPSCHVTP